VLVTNAHAVAVQSFLAVNDLKAADNAAIGFPGQTLLHRLERALTIQIGDGAALAGALKIPVIPS
jgi:anhydro-N-acetylmuramic acid kinase